MRIAYRVTPDDIVAWNRHVTESAPYLRALLVVVALLVGAILYWIVAAGTGATAAAVVTALAGGVLYLVAAPRLLRLLVGIAVRRRLRAAGSGLLGEHEMEITDGTLVGRSPGAESQTWLAAIPRIVRRPERAFIYLDARSALILPRAGILAGDYEAFLDQLSAAIGRARN